MFDSITDEDIDKADAELDSGFDGSMPETGYPDLTGSTEGGNADEVGSEPGNNPEESVSANQ